MTAPDISLYPRLGLTTNDEHTVLRFDPMNKRLVCFVTTGDDGTEVAWDLCGRCFTHVTICPCKAGPQVPSYIREVTPATKPVDAAAPARLVMPTRTKPKPEYHPTTGRKVRADKGAPRTPKAAVPAPAAKLSLAGPCALHTAESKVNADGTYTCTVDGCAGVR